MRKSEELADSTEMFLKEIEKYPILPEHEQQELLKRYKQQNDKEAYQKLYNHSLRLSVFVAKKKIDRCTNMQLMDLIQENNIVLMEAIESYNPDFRTLFSTYAIELMKRQLEKEINKQDESVRIKYKQNSHYKEYQKFATEFYKKYNRYPTLAEVQETLNYSDKIMESITIVFNSKTTSLNIKLSQEDEKSKELEDLIEDQTDNYTKFDDKYDELILIQSLRENLTPKEFYVIYKRIIEKPAMTLQALGDELNLSGTSIKNIEKGALSRFKENIEEFQRKTLKKHKLDLKEQNFEPLSPLEISYMHFMKRKLPNLLYYIIFNKKFSPQNDNIEFYKRKFPLYDIKDISEEMSLAEDFIKDLKTKEEELEIIHEQYKRTKTISQIFELDILPEKQEKKYAYIMSYFKNTEYQDIEHNDYIMSLDEKSKKLLKRYFEKNQHPKINQKRRFSMIERYINLTLLGYYKQNKFNIDKIEISQIIEKNREKLTNYDLDFINLYFLDNKNDKSTKDIDLNSANYYKNKLLKLKFNIDHFFELSLTREQIISVKEQYPDFLTKTEQYIINEYYGINGERKSLEEIATELEQNKNDIVRLESYLRIKILKKYFKIGQEEKDIDKEEFLKYIRNPRYEFTDDMRTILSLYIIEKKSLDDIAKTMNSTSTKVSNNLNECIRAANMYRYGIKKILLMTEEEFHKLSAENNYSEIERTIVHKHYILNKNIEDISKETNQDLKTVKEILKKAYSDYLILRIPTLTISDYESEVNAHISDSILTEEERKLISLAKGLKNKYNSKGKEYTKEEIKKEYKLEDRKYRHKIEMINQKLRERKCNLKDPKYGILSQEETEKLLNYTDLPITPREKEILLDLKGINTEHLLSEQDIAKKYNLSIGSLKRRYNRIILSLKQYKNSIKETISYQSQIKPIEKYFSEYDRRFLLLFYKEQLTITEIAKQLKLTFDQTNYSIQQLQIKVKSILNNEQTACIFDFDYARSVIDKKDLPLKQDKELSIKIYQMLTGEAGYKKHSKTEVMQILNLNCTTPVITKAMYDVMIAVEKYRLGERKNTLVTPEEVLTFYQKNKDKLPNTTRKRYEKYLKNKHNTIEESIPQRIVYEILKENNKLVFNLSKKSKKEMIEIIRKKSINLPSGIIIAIKKYFHIEERIFMSGKETIKALKLLEPLYQSKKNEHKKTKSLNCKKLS